MHLTVFDPTTIAPALLRVEDPLSLRIEESFLNATATREQMMYDGWLIRWNNGHMLRTRCVNALGPGQGTLDARLGFCARWYARHGMKTTVRISPFSQPIELDAALALRGFEAVDDRRMMAADLSHPPEMPDTGLHFELVDRERFAREIGRRLGVPEQYSESNVAQLLQLPMDAMPLLAMHRRRCVGGVLVVLDDTLAGIYDLVVDPNTRGLGIGRSLLASAMGAAVAHGAQHAVLQVAASNTPARNLYCQYGFQDRFAYWYRRAPDNFAG
ncbi:GNAT family N-acetyltransferase [Pigmentiphaga aceris]|uniref:GNAT family N-acetyltransferase n=1 Tax=Pigmentiphaga aceris TaxID=1940612 RepID=A0A5C0B5Q0_9BURK|nr:GNAT family N-acetyltransferase [Pigmentiphaga aceris]QEI08993.1 GNAT family N-acetyltransferase [Pigmentiphaga aceris]